LCLKNCTWLDNYEEDLYLFDAGTDSGLSYNSPNHPTLPQEMIKKIESGSNGVNMKSPFYDSTGKKMEPVARLFISKIKESGSTCNGPEIKTTEFDANDLSDENRRNDLLGDSNKKTKKNRKKPMKFKIIEQLDPQCLTTEWSSWTKCSSICGNGIRKRSREFKNAKMAMAANCSNILIDNEMCLSENGECENTDDQTMKIDEKDLYNLKKKTNKKLN
jgi:spondin-1